jgi:hypothetical protein
VCTKCAGTFEIIGQRDFTDPDAEYYVYWFYRPPGAEWNGL